MPSDLQREIEDLLDKLDEFIPEQKAPGRLHRRWSALTGGLRAWLGGIVSRVTLGHLMVVSLILVFFAFLMRSSSIGRYALIAGLALLFLTIAVSFFTSKRPKQEKVWRGQVVDLSQPGLASRIQGWLRKRRGSRR
jgi:dolichyl-phosphate-mannose--protein O-mannosyl transferase